MKLDDMHKKIDTKLLNNLRISEYPPRKKYNIWKIGTRFLCDK